MAPSSWLCILDILSSFGVESAEFLYIEQEWRRRVLEVRLMIRNPRMARFGILRAARWGCSEQDDPNS